MKARPRIYFRIVCVLCNRLIQAGKEKTPETIVSVCRQCREKGRNMKDSAISARQRTSK
jgi:ribosome-binding protein aMBF1 (putative translation factor)